MKIPFNVDAHTARLIGRENVSKLDGAILELVKNSYDAGAGICVLYYEASTESVYLIDNGSGMSENQIQENWMTIGYSAKKSNYKLPSGRIQTGAKGIGRFALDRISDECKMYSKMDDSSIEWNVNWADFDTGQKITEVNAELKNIEYNFDYFFKDILNLQLRFLLKEKINNKGTAFKLSSLREDGWSEELLKKIRENLATLIPPEISEDFQIFVFSESSSIEESKVLINDGIYSYDYKIEFKVNEEGLTKLQIHRDEFDFGNKFEEIIRETEFTKDDKEYFEGLHITKNLNFNEILADIKDNTIGDFRGTLYFSKKSQPGKPDQEKYFYKDITSRVDVDKTFGGIKLYRDNFRVRPYGEPNATSFDWLGLSNRKYKSPAAISHPSGSWRVAADQVVGSIHISRDNLTLPDQSNREGIVETKEFILLREFLTEIISFMEKDRQYVCRILKKYYDDINPIEEAEEEITIKARKYSNKKNTLSDKQVDAKKAKAVIDDKKAKIKELEDENRLLRALATTGIVTNTYIHEIKDATSRLGTKIATTKNALVKDKPKERITQLVNESFEIQQSFKSWFSVTVDMVKRDKREMKYVPLKPFLSTLINNWGKVLEGRSIQINSEIPDIEFRCFPYDIESIFNNLIANSIKSFEKGELKDFIIDITMSNSEKALKISYSDNGKGLNDKYKKEPELILKPFETSSRDSSGTLVGTGMGMWIIHKTVNEYKGNIDFDKNLTSEEGFFIDIELIGGIK